MEKIIQVNALDQYKEDSIEYALDVNRRRMVPEGKDGCKTVHRRILAAMFFDEKVVSKKKKCATLVGTAMKYHPHGDASIYNSMVGLSNWFETYMPLVEGHGNFGSVQGDQCAAPRYTEAKLSQYAIDTMIADGAINKEVIDWIPTYDDANIEPEFFTPALPQLLIEGAFGIGYGMKTEIPPHNIDEVIDATIKLIDDPKADFVLKPDQCMKCQIGNTNWKKINNIGNGTFKVRGVIDIEEIGKDTFLVIKSTPDLVFLNSVVEGIENMIRNKEIIDITDMYDDTQGDDEATCDMRFMLQLRRGVDPNYIREVIYKRTGMEKTCKINFECLINYKPKRLSYRAYLLYFIENRKTVKMRLYCNELQKVETNYHRTEAFVKLLESGQINEIIDLIKKRKQGTDDDLAQAIMKRLNITDMQAFYIINASLKQLSPVYLSRYREEAARLLGLKKDYTEKILSDKLLLEEIKHELMEIKGKYHKARKSTFIELNDSNIPEGEFTIIITENNFIKKLPGADPMGNLKLDNPKYILKVQNSDSLIILDEIGKAYKLPVHKIPISVRTSNGIDIRSIIKTLTSNIINVIPESIIKTLDKSTSKYFLTLVTKQGQCKKMDLSDFTNVPLSGIITIKLEPNDFVVSTQIVHNKLDLLFYTNDKAIRINMKDVPHQKRNTKGLKIANTVHFIEGMCIVAEGDQVVVVTKRGIANKFSIVGLPVSARGRAPSKVIKLGKGDEIKSIHLCYNKDNIRLITTENSAGEFITVESIKDGSSISPGQKIINLKSSVIVRVDVKR